MRARAYAYLEQALAAEPPTNEGWWPSYTAWQSFAVKVLVEGGRNQDSNLTRLYGYRDRMPVFALAYLHDAMVARGASVSRLDRPHRRPPPPHGQRHPARGGQRARRGAERSVSALVLELQRAFHVDRAQLAREGQRQRRAGPADGALDDGGAQGRTLGQHAGERAGDGGARRLLPEVRERAAGLPRGRQARHRGLRPRGVQGTLDDVEDEGAADGQGAGAGAGRLVASADVHARRHRHALLHRAPALRLRRALPGGPGQRHPDRALVRALCRDGHAAGGDQLQGRRSRARHA